MTARDLFVRAPARLVALTILLGICALPAAAQQNAPVTPAPPDAQAPGPAAPMTVPLDAETGDRIALALARRKLAEGKPLEARRILAILEHRRPQDRDVQILIAQAEIMLGNPDAAIQRLEALRDLHPDWPRPRVELALAHAAAGNVRKAKAILIAELGKDPPPHVRRNIEAAIRAIEDGQTFLPRFNIGVNPDSNVNAGSSADSVNFGGVPLSLNDDAKQQQGLRAEFGIGGSLRSQWRENVRLEASVDAYHSEPLQAVGDPNSNVIFAGAVRTRSRKTSTRTGIAIQPYFYNNEKLRHERHIFFEAYRAITPRFGLFGRFAFGDGAVNNSDAQDFSEWDASIGPSIRVGDTGWLYLSFLFRDRSAEDDVFSYIRRGLNVTAVAAPWNGWRMRVSGEITRDVYEDFNLAYGVQQEDLVRSARIEFTKTGTVLWGFSPKFGIGHSRVESTIDLYDRDSTSLILGVGLPY